MIGLIIADKTFLCINNHFYTIGSDIWVKSEGGSIGSDLTREIARIYMLSGFLVKYHVNCNAVYSQRYDNKEDSIYEDLYYLYNPPPYNYRDPFTYPYRSNNTWNLDITKVA